MDFSTKTVVSPFTGLVDGQTRSVFVATVVANEAAAVGNTGKDVLINVERVIGTVGNDSFILTDAGQSVWGGEGKDTVVTGLQSFSLRGQADISIENLATTFSKGAYLGGSEGNNTITGGDGADTLSGFGGDDRLDGGKGTGLDTVSYEYATQGVTVDLKAGVGMGEGSDTLVSIENVLGSGYNDRLIGSEVANTLNGGLGADFMAAGAGDDVYFVDSLLDQVIELSKGVTAATEGKDTVILTAAVSGYTLASNVEVLDASKLTALDYTSKWSAKDANNNFVVLSNAGVSKETFQTNQLLTISGNSGSNTILGGLGVDYLMGGGVATGGTDTLIGGLGGDMYLYDGAHVTIVEDDKGGTDLVLVQAATYKLGTFIENAMVWNDVSFVSDIDLTGNDSANVLHGGYGSNTIKGGAGDDVIAGYGGEDYLMGEGGADLFVWGVQGYEGVIADFSNTVAGAKDRIWLGFSPLDDGAVASKALKYDLSHLSDAQSANGTQFTMNSAPGSEDMMQAQVIYDKSTGLLQIDIPVWSMTTEGVGTWSARDGQADAQMFVYATNGTTPVTASLSEADFVGFDDKFQSNTDRDWTYHPMT